MYRPVSNSLTCMYCTKAVKSLKYTCNKGMDLPAHVLIQTI